MSTVVGWILRLPGKGFVLKKLNNAVHYDSKTKQLSSFFIHTYSLIISELLPVLLKLHPGAELVDLVTTHSPKFPRHCMLQGTQETSPSSLTFCRCEHLGPPRKWTLKKLCGFSAANDLLHEKLSFSSLM